MSQARKVLHRLFLRCESARLKEATALASIVMSSKRDAKEYHDLSGLSGLEAFHGEIALAEREGAIIVQRDSYRGDGERLLRISVADLDRLAAFLDLQSHASRLEHARRSLDPWLNRLPVLATVLDTWTSGRKVCGCEVGNVAVTDLMSAVRVVLEQRPDQGNERVLRSESVRLFGDSKRLEKLTPWLGVLVSAELSSGLHAEEIWALLGLRRVPQPLLFAGKASLLLRGGARIELPRPYLGVPMEVLEEICSHASYLLTVENLASFHEVARLQPEGLLIYTGGMPSPAWCAVYRRVLQSLPIHAWIGHWGDIDEGGFRIAALLSQEVKTSGRSLQPWLMSPEALPSAAVHSGQVPTSSQLSAMQRYARRAGWDYVADALQKRPLVLEQEAIPAQLPASA